MEKSGFVLGDEEDFSVLFCASNIFWCEKLGVGDDKPGYSMRMLGGTVVT